MSVRFSMGRASVCLQAETLFSGVSAGFFDRLKAQGTDACGKQAPAEV